MSELINEKSFDKYVLRDNYLFWNFNVRFSIAVMAMEYVKPLVINLFVTDK